VHLNGASLLAKNRKEGLEANWLFPSEARTPLSDRNLINRHIYPVSKKLGIPHFLLAFTSAHVLNARRK